MVCARFSVFSSPPFAFSSSADETSFMPCLKSNFSSSQLSNLVLAVRMRHSGRSSSSPSPLFSIFYQPLITNPSPPPHHMGPSPFKPKTATSTISNRLCHPPFLPPLLAFFFPLQPSCSAHLGVFISLYPFLNFQEPGSEAWNVQHSRTWDQRMGMAAS